MGGTDNRVEGNHRHDPVPVPVVVRFKNPHPVVWVWISKTPAELVNKCAFEDLLAKRK